MLIVPELETVFILVPRTGSGTLYRELIRVYPKSMLLYRHMEADGCPKGYDRWKRIGFVRHPLYRLWSLYNYLKAIDPVRRDDTTNAARQRAQTVRPFEDWLLNNNEPFSVPYDLTGEGNFWPGYTRSNAAPENKLSQFQYLRPDIGTKVLHFSELKIHMQIWGLNSAVIRNKSARALSPPTSPAIRDHLEKFCRWDLQQQCEEV